MDLAKYIPRIITVLIVKLLRLLMHIEHAETDLILYNELNEWLKRGKK
jgi:hypothetical protein